jgi:hypothetical protein
MLISVSAFGFEWGGKVTRRLWAGAYGGTLVLERRLTVVDNCEIREVPEGDGYSMFYGLQKVFGTPYNRNLVANRFAIGDKLLITISDSVPESIFWESMQDAAA